MATVLSPYALVTNRTKALALLGRAAGDAEEDRAIDAWNWVTGAMERETGRRLCVRSYRNPATISCGSTLSSTTLTGSGFTALKVWDDVVGTRIAPGTRIASIESATSLTLSLAALTTGTVSATFGSAPLTISGDGTGDVWVPEYPLNAVYSVSSVDDNAVRTALSLTGARILSAETGQYHLTQAVMPSGAQNIEVECQAGYRPPTSADLGHPEWDDLERLATRLAIIAFQDQSRLIGRVVSEQLTGVGMTMPGFDIPADIRAGLRRYARLW